jgi:hypothetical protein
MAPPIAASGQGGNWSAAGSTSAVLATLLLFGASNFLLWLSRPTRPWRPGLFLSQAERPG